MATIVTAIKDSLQTLSAYNSEKNTLSEVMVREGVKRRESDESDKILSTPAGLYFCNKYDKKKIKVKGSWTTEALSSFEYGGGVTIVREAGRKKDENF